MKHNKGVSHFHHEGSLQGRTGHREVREISRTAGRFQAEPAGRNSFRFFIFILLLYIYIYFFVVKDVKKNEKVK